MRYLVVFTLALTLALPVAAQDFEKGEEAYKRGDFAATLREWRPLAEQGDAVAQVGLGFMYDKGYGVAQDYAEAAKWYRRAAEQGNDRAQFNLGLMYNNGEGVPQDYFEAMRWYREAAEQGRAGAQFNLGAMHANGRGVPLDYVQAHMWFSLAAAQGYAGAIKNRKIVLKEMWPWNVWKAKRLAREWMEKHGK